MFTLGRCLALEAHGKLSSAITSFFEPFDHPFDSFDYRQLSSTIMRRLTRALSPEEVKQNYKQANDKFSSMSAGVKTNIKLK